MIIQFFPESAPGLNAAYNLQVTDIDFQFCATFREVMKRCLSDSVLLIHFFSPECMFLLQSLSHTHTQSVLCGWMREYLYDVYVCERERRLDSYISSICDIEYLVALACLH